MSDLLSANIMPHPHLQCTASIAGARTPQPTDEVWIGRDCLSLPNGASASIVVAAAREDSKLREPITLSESSFPLWQKLPDLPVRFILFLKSSLGWLTANDLNHLSDHRRQWVSADDLGRLPPDELKKIRSCAGFSSSASAAYIVARSWSIVSKEDLNEFLESDVPARLRKCRYPGLLDSLGPQVKEALRQQELSIAKNGEKCAHIDSVVRSVTVGSTYDAWLRAVEENGWLREPDTEDEAVVRLKAITKKALSIIDHECEVAEEAQRVYPHALFTVDLKAAYLDIASLDLIK